MSCEIMTKIFARDRNLTPNLEHILKCGTHPAQIDANETLDDMPSASDEDFSDLPF